MRTAATAVVIAALAVAGCVGGDNTGSASKSPPAETEHKRVQARHDPLSCLKVADLEEVEKRGLIPGAALSPVAVNRSSWSGSTRPPGRVSLSERRTS